jgi:hypothetical protein
MKFAGTKICHWIEIVAVGRSSGGEEVFPYRALNYMVEILECFEIIDKVTVH